MPIQSIMVHLNSFFHKGKHCHGIYFGNYRSLNVGIRAAGTIWSDTYKCWYTPLS
jgi:hypothetical protein